MSEKDKIDARLPRTLFDALQVDVGELRRQGWSSTPGTRWIDYTRPRDLLSPLPVTSARSRPRLLPTAARFAIAGSVPPRLTEALYFCERVRVALMSRSNAAPAFSGKHADGHPMSGHRHAFILPEANGASGRITHVSLYALMGFDEAARRAMDGLRKVWGWGGHDAQLVLLGVGLPKDFAGANLEAGHCPLFASSRTWRSATPFVPTRHAKMRGGGIPKLDERGLQVGGPEHDLIRLIARAGLPEPEIIEPLTHGLLGTKRVSWLDFKTVRKGGNGARAGNRGYGFRIRFPRPVAGPIALGFGAHFGLGLFVPEDVH